MSNPQSSGQPLWGTGKGFPGAPSVAELQKNGSRISPLTPSTGEPALSRMLRTIHRLALAFLWSLTWPRNADFSDRLGVPEAKVKREESPKASSPQRLNFSRRRTHIPAAVPSYNSSSRVCTNYSYL